MDLQPAAHAFDGGSHERAGMADDDDGLAAAAGGRVRQRVREERNAGDRHQRLRHVAAARGQTRTTSCREYHCLHHRGSVHQLILIRSTASNIRVTFDDLTDAYERARIEAPGTDAAAPSAADGFERETIAILKRLSRRPIEPAPDSELMADLGFDSLQVLELVGELEDHFNIAVPLNDLTHIRTVRQIASAVRRLAGQAEASS
jgi:acyl carrier protein